MDLTYENVSEDDILAVVGFLDQIVRDLNSLASDVKRLFSIREYVNFLELIGYWHFLHDKPKVRELLFLGEPSETDILIMVVLNQKVREVKFLHVSASDILAVVALDQGVREFDS